MVNLWLLRFITLSILALILCAAISLTAPVGIDSELSSWLREHEATEATSVSPTLSVQPPASLVGASQRALGQPLDIDELTPEELFRALVIRDTQPVQKYPSTPATLRSYDIGVAAGRGSGRWTNWKLPEIPNLLKSSMHLVTFDEDRPPVRLPVNEDDVYKSVKSYANDLYYGKLNRNHDARPIKGGDDEELAKQTAKRKEESNWREHIRPQTRSITMHQVAKEGIRAKMLTREWASRMQQDRPGLMREQAVQDSLKRTWLLWLKGIKDASGSFDVPIEQIMSKIHRRR